jgi:hypothetical protein
VRAGDHRVLEVEGSGDHRIGEGSLLSRNPKAVDEDGGLRFSAELPSHLDKRSTAFL